LIPPSVIHSFLVVSFLVYRIWLPEGEVAAPLLRFWLAFLGPHQLPGHPQFIGGYWTRRNDPQVNLIGADREPVAHQAVISVSEILALCL
jgi:hypothetical protein